MQYTTLDSINASHSANTEIHGNIRALAVNNNVFNTGHKLTKLIMP